MAVGAERRGVDLLDELYEFQAGFGRKPESWKDFQYGMAYIGRATVRQKLQMNEAVLMTQTKKEDRERWSTKNRHLAGI